MIDHDMLVAKNMLILYRIIIIWSSADTFFCGVGKLDIWCCYLYSHAIKKLKW